MSDASDPLEAKLLSDIEEFGWHVLKVFSPDVPDLVWTYSVGVFHTFARPEISVFGIHPDDAHVLVNEIVGAIGTDHDLAVGEDIQLLADNRRSRLLPVSRHHYRAYFGRAVDFYGGDGFEMISLVWSDENNLYPWEVGCAEIVRNLQPDLTPGEASSLGRG